MEDARTSGNLSLGDRFGRKFATVDGAPPLRNDSGQTIRRKRKLSCNEMMVFCPQEEMINSLRRTLSRYTSIYFLKTRYPETEYDGGCGDDVSIRF